MPTKLTDAALARHTTRYEQLGISTEMERAVIEYLSELHVLANCFAPGGGCGSCPPGQTCIKTIRNNCVCQNNQ